MIVQAQSIDEIREAVRDRATLPVAGASKPALWRGHDDRALLDVSHIRGLIEYDPAELTFTALAATPVSEVNAALAENGQCLPFDPPFVQAGATLAGAVAAGASGPGGFRHGGVRDFVIGVQFVDGTGRLVSGGGRVVKNAAGFDLPKLMVGSMGRLGVMTRLSFKVLPRPRCTTTLVFSMPSLADALAAVMSLGRGPLQLDALDITADGRLLVRLGGEPEPMTARARRCAEIVGASHERLDGQRESDEWAAATELGWAGRDTEIVRVALTPASALALHDGLSGAGASVRLSLGANVAWVAWPTAHPMRDLDRVLRDLGLRGMRLTGDTEGGSALLGVPQGGPFAQRVSRALDPNQRFAAL